MSSTMLQPPSPGGLSEGGSPRRGFSLLSNFKTRSMPRSESNASLSQAGSDGGLTPKSRMFPSFSNGQRKREIIKDLQEQVDLLNLQVHQQGVDLHKLTQQLAAERDHSGGLRERLNLQYFKANLLVDMLVLRLLDVEAGVQGSSAKAAIQSAPETAGSLAAGQAQKQQEPTKTAGTAVAAAGVMHETSFDSDDD